MTATCGQFDALSQRRAGNLVSIRRCAHVVFALSSRALCFCALLACALIAAGAPQKAKSDQQAPQGSQSTAPPDPKQNSADTQPARKWRLLTRAEGRSILKAAWKHEQLTARAQDCSHLVHEIYSTAGHEFPYATSFDLYAGNPNFARVKHPQAGDVIAWPGHVGIVVNPGRHSFFSLVSSGAQAENYTSAYWRSRGYPRFYRLLVLKQLSREDRPAPAAPSRTYRSCSSRCL
jgi:cell wall-associated NlpC family hydrolase